MESKVWYSLTTTHPQAEPSGFLKISSRVEFELHKDLIQKSIDLFNSEIEWDDMWTLKDASERINKGAKLFLLTEDLSAPIGHVWIKEGYLFNLYAAPFRVPGSTREFVLAACSQANVDNITLYCDDWNVKAQRFFEKIGATKVAR